MIHEDKSNVILAGQNAIRSHYLAARQELANKGSFGKELDRRARKLALTMAGVVLPEGWTIATVTPTSWGQGPSGYRSPSIY
jgi:hypothetical protein